MANPRQIDAVIIVSAPIGAPSSPSLWRYIIRMNHTDVPPTPLLLDLFDVSPTPTNGLGYYRDYWFFTNLQVRWNSRGWGAIDAIKFIVPELVLH